VTNLHAGVGIAWAVLGHVVALITDRLLGLSLHKKKT